MNAIHNFTDNLSNYTSKIMFNFHDFLYKVFHLIEFKGIISMIFYIIEIIES